MNLTPNVFMNFTSHIGNQYLFSKRYTGNSRPEVFLEITQNAQENTCVRVSFLIKLQASDRKLYQKKDTGTGVFM